MKKYLLSISAIVLTTGTLVFTGCQKDDATAPVITVNGGDVTISLQGTYTELGATATDDKDGSIVPTISGTVDNNNTGVYTITYSATDAAGNTAEETRKVTVKNDAEAAWAGFYKGSGKDAVGSYTYLNDTVFVTASTKINNQIIVTPFGDFRNNAVFMNVVGTTITIPTQIHTNVGKVGSDPCSVHNRQTTSGTGVKTATGFKVNYADTKVSPCTGARASVDDVFVKQ